jgi:site-specific DNA recombinase
MATMRGKQGTSPDARVDALVAWAEESGRRRAGGPARGGLRFVFYGRVSTEDWQDPVTSRARQREQAEALVRGHGVIMAEFSTLGRAARWRGAAARRPPRWSPSCGGPGPGLGRDRDR